MPTSHRTQQAGHHSHEPAREPYFKQLEVVSGSYIDHHGSKAEGRHVNSRGTLETETQV